MHRSGFCSLLLALPLVFAGCEQGGMVRNAAMPAAPQETAPPKNAPAETGPQAPDLAGLPFERLPFERLQAIVLAAAPGEIIEVELEGDDHDEHRPERALHEAVLYEFKVLAASGRVVEVTIDARTGAIIELEAE
jgi:uncharacterized membrane protein YkoI